MTRPNTAPPPAVTAVGVLDRAVAVLGAVDAGARTFTAITETTGLTRSTAHRLINALETHGFLLQTVGIGYALGPRLLELASAAMHELPLRDLARPALERLVRSTGESAQLYVRSADERVAIDTAESSAELRTIVAVGARLPLTSGSAAKLFLAHAADAERLLARLAARDRDRVRRQAATARRRGWASSVGERQAGVASVSAPVLSPRGDLLAVVSISGPAGRIGNVADRGYLIAVQAAAREIEGALGGVPSTGA